jgi:hypothetical protein
VVILADAKNHRDLESRFETQSGLSPRGNEER